MQATAGAGVTVSDAARWVRIDEYAYADPRGSTGAFAAGTTVRAFAARSVIDGSTNAKSEPVVSVAPDAEPPPGDLVARHLPPGGFPYFEGANSPAAVVVTEAPFGAVAGGDVDAATATRNTLAIQAAIDAAAAEPRLAGRVFLPKGEFQISGKLVLRGTTQLFGAGKCNLAMLSAHASWQPTATPGVLIETVDDPGASCYLGSLDLTVPKRNLYENPFTFLHWRAGAASMTHDLRAECGLWLNRPRFDPARIAPFVCARFDGGAGGRHYFFGNFEQQFTASASPVDGAGFRSVVIDRTSQPLWFYGFNNEGGKTDRRATDVEVLGARNVVMLGFKREGGAPMLTLRDCRDVALLGGGAMREAPKGRTGAAAAAYVELTGICSRVLVAGLLVQQVADGGGGYTVWESAADGAAVPFPLGAAVFQRGDFDWCARGPGQSAPSESGDGPANSRLANVAARVRWQAGDGPAVIGFVVTGAGTRTVLLRAVGPGLATLGVGDGVSDPKLRLYRGPTLVAENDDWSVPAGQLSGATFSAAGAFPLEVGSRDAAIVATLGPGEYTASTTAGEGARGTLLLEVYDWDGNSAARLVNLSLLTKCGGGGENPIVGFVVAGAGTRGVLVRAAGPSLAAFGVADGLADPAFRLFRAGVSTEGNDDWEVSTGAAELLRATTGAGAFAFTPGGRDAAVYVPLSAGNYTVHILGSSGRVLTEIYAP